MVWRNNLNLYLKVILQFSTAVPHTIKRKEIIEIS